MRVWPMVVRVFAFEDRAYFPSSMCTYSISQLFAHIAIIYSLFPKDCTY